MEITKYVRVIALMALPVFAQAQNIQIANNAHFVMNGNVKMVLRNAGIVSSGFFRPGQSRVIFTGNQDVVLGSPRSPGSPGSLEFNDVVLSKTDGKSITLGTSIVLKGKLQFASGFINLNGESIALLQGAIFENERNGSRIIGTNGGEVLVVARHDGTINAFTPGNIGLELSFVFVSTEFIVTRKHVPVILGNGAISIKRFFSVRGIAPHGVGPIVGFHYFPAELNGQDEANLSIFHRLLNGDVVPIPTEVDTAANKLTANLSFLGDIYAGAPAPSVPSSSQGVQNGNTDRLINNGIYIYPNPAHTQFSLQFNSKQEKNITLRLFDQSGRMLQQKQVSATAGLNTISWNVSAYPAGLYYISSENGEMKNAPFFKQ